MKCPNCGGPWDREDRCCIYCGTRFERDKDAESKQEIHIHYHQEQRAEPHVRVEHIYTPMEMRSTRSRTFALVLCIFLGLFGAHKFYLGKIGMGVIYLLTYGLFGIGWVIDLFILTLGNPKDKEGDRLTWH